MVTFDAHTKGTPSAIWESDFRLTLAEEVDLDEIRELIVIAAHPDDETLGAGGLIATAAERQIPIQVVVVTDGAGSHPRSRSMTPGQLADRRVAEVYSAVSILAPDARTTLLGFPDGRTAEFAQEISDALRQVFAAAGAHAHVVVVWSGDGHSDHETVGRIAERWAPADARVWGYPIWAWHWGHPDTGVLPWERARILPLPRRIGDRKRRALAAHVSQLEPLSADPGDERVLEPEVLEHFARDRELYLDVRPGASS